MSFKLKIFFSPSFYIRTGLFVLAMVLFGLLFLRVDSLTWLLFKSLSVFAAALITGGIFGYFKTLPFKPALSKVLLGLFKLLVGFVVICCAVAALLFWMADPFNLSAPADQKLIMLFHDHREAFEKLREMATEDLGRASYITQFDIEGNINEARKQEYQTLLSEIYPRGLRYPGLQVGGGPDGVRFIFAGGGLSAISGGWLKGIEYHPENRRRIGTIVQNLDKANTLPPDVYLREIEPNWYIVYQNLD
jgi:hypothetical protein